MLESLPGRANSIFSKIFRGEILSLDLWGFLGRTSHSSSEDRIFFDRHRQSHRTGNCNLSLLLPTGRFSLPFSWLPGASACCARLSGCLDSSVSSGKMCLYQRAGKKAFP
jgi:hypothetical protein